jgi:hypothetical protein
MAFMFSNPLVRWSAYKIPGHYKPGERGYFTLSGPALPEFQLDNVINYIFRLVSSLVFTGHSLNLFRSFPMECKLDFVKQTQEKTLWIELPDAE